MSATIDGTQIRQTLAARLADAEAEVHAAQEALGRVLLDNGDAKAASRRVSEARDLIDGLRLAAAEGERRAETAAYAEGARRAAVARWRYFSWHAEQVKLLAPVLRLRAELRAAEEHAMTLSDLNAVWIDEFAQWLSSETNAGLEPIDLPRTMSKRMRFHGAHAHCTGEIVQANDGALDVESAAVWASTLARLVKEAAKPLGAEAKPAALPWKVA
jgi:hypothetical protein